MIGIYDINECTNLTYKQRLDIYKKIGFRELALYIDDNYNKPNERYEDIVKYAGLIGLKINQVHIDYKISNLICDTTSNCYFDYVCRKLNEALKLKIPYVVAHASMSDNPPILDNKQLQKFAEMMKGFANKNVYLCLENVRNNTNLFKILQLELSNVKICFDIGHAHCYDNESDLYQKLQDFIVCSHLHNNYGKDTHNPPLDGEIDIAKFIEKFKSKQNCSNCLECFPPRNSQLNKQEFELFVQKLYDEIN